MPKEIFTFGEVVLCRYRKGSPYIYTDEITCTVSIACGDSGESSFQLKKDNIK